MVYLIAGIGNHCVSQTAEGSNLQLANIFSFKISDVYLQNRYKMRLMFKLCSHLNICVYMNDK